MRVAFFSPLPPARSGIADYSEALIASMKPLADLDIFSGDDPAFHPARYDIAVYTSAITASTGSSTKPPSNTPASS